MEDRVRTPGAASGSSVNETQAGAQTGGSQAGAGAGYQSAGAEVTSDVGQAEAYILNMKRLVEEGQNLDALSHQILVAAAQRISGAAGDFDAQVRKLSLDALALGNVALGNAVSLANRQNDNGAETDKKVDSINQSERERTLRNGDVLDVIREAGVSADTTVFQDVVEAAAVKAAEKVKASMCAK